MKALRDVEFDGIVIPDHVPRMEAPATTQAKGGTGNDPYGLAGLAYSIAYMRALRDRANREAKA